MSEPVVEVLVLGFPSDIRTALIDEAQARDLSANEVAARILSAAYNVKRIPKDSRFQEFTADTDRMTFRIPEKLRTKLRVAAARNGDTIRGLVIAELAAHYELPFTGGRRPRTTV